MKIIAGSLGGRQFESPKSTKTHPMSDKVRGALFNVLGDIEGLHILDAFAGSGALSFEAASRGAERVVAIDVDRTAQAAIAASITALDLQNNVKLVRASTNAWLQTSDSVLFDIIFCDPPYNDLQPNLLGRITQRVKLTGLFVLCWPGKLELLSFDGLELVERYDYGDATLAFYRRIS